MPEKLILIDGHSILNRAFYGIPHLTTSDGTPTNAVYGFLNILFRILDEENADYLAVAFDVHAPTFRHGIYKEYKGTRKPMPDELRIQVPMIKEMLEAMNVPLLMLEGYEADDLIGTVSRQAQEQGLNVTVVSGDRDLLQLSSENVCIRIPKTKQTGTEIEDYYPKDVKEKYNVTPSEIIDLKALMGDASDNIPGIPGVGEKTAARIIEQFHSIENAYAHVDEIQPKKAQNSLREHYDLAQLSKTLAAINRESPVSLKLEDARIGDLFTPEAQALCRKYEFRNLLSRFTFGSEEKKEDLFRMLPFSEADAFLDEAQKGSVIGLALFGEEDRGPAAAAVSIDGEKTVVFADGDEQEKSVFLTELSKLCSRKKTAVFDLKSQLSWLGAVTSDTLYDLSVAIYLINPLSGSYTYADAAKDYAGKLVPSREELAGKKSFQSLLEEDREKAALYAGYQAKYAAVTFRPVMDRLEKEEMLDLFRQIEMPLVFTLYDMQKEGIQVRGEELVSYGRRLEGRIRELEKSIWDQAGTQFNIQSPKQLGTILFEQMKLPGGKKTKTGYSTAADVLEKLAEDSPIVADILEYRQLTKLKSTYADGLYAFIQDDGRIHGKFHQTITATGRISSTDPNLQNIPVRTELGRELRKVFVPKEGCVFVDADYSQIELRVLAHMSGDEKLIEAYRQAQDIHAATASEVFHIPIDRVTAQERRNAKAVNFGIVYGISSFGLSQDLSITRKEAQDYIEQYFRTYPGIKAFLDRCVIDAKEKGYSRTLLGRRRPVPELHSSNFMQRSFGERVAMNAPIQGTAADIIKIAMIRVHQRLQKEGLRSKLILQIHDELLVEAYLEEQDQVKKILREEMMGAADLEVPLEIDMHTGESWYEAK